MKEQKPYNVLYSDDAIVVLNKASGILTASDRYDATAPRLDLLAKDEFGTLYAVHRIDKDTSGAVIYARTKESHRDLSLQFQNREVEKIYHAIVYGRPLWERTVCDKRLLINGDARHRTIVHRTGKDASTEFFVFGTCGQFSWIEARPKTGRTHQIRAHLNELGFSIVCDPLYGGNQKPIRLSEVKRSWRGDPFEEKPLIARLALHAWRLCVVHPVTNEKMTFTAPYYKDMDATRKQFAKLFKVDPLLHYDAPKNFCGELPCL